MFRLTKFLSAIVIGAFATATFAQTSEQTTTARDRHVAGAWLSRVTNSTSVSSRRNVARDHRKLTRRTRRDRLREVVDVRLAHVVGRGGRHDGVDAARVVAIDGAKKIGAKIDATGRTSRSMVSN